jgi:outer membrane murein-binding lipoprotein Lpp
MAGQQNPPQGGTNPGGAKAVSPEFQQSFDRLKAAVGSATSRIDQLSQQVKAGMTDQEAAGVRQQLDQLSDALEAAVNPPPAPPPAP